MVLFHLQQSVSLNDELNELVPTEIDRKNLEVAARVMVKIMKTEKKTFPLMLDKQRPVRKDVNYKSDSTPIGTPNFKADGTVMTTTSSKSKGTPMTTVFFKSKGTPRGTHSSKSDGTPMCMIKYQVSSEDVYPDKCGSMENVQGQVKKIKMCPASPSFQ